MHDLFQAIQHRFHRIANAQRLARRISQRQRRRIQRGGVEVFRLQACVELWLIADHSLAETRHWPGKRHHRQATYQVVENVEVDNQLSFRQWQIIHRVRQRMHKRQNNQAAHQLKQQTAERHTTGGGVGAAVVQHCQQSRAKVGTDHQTQCHRE
ncbi:hypothetical protein D3C78_1188300 [compost metagenome]